MLNLWLLRINVNYEDIGKGGDDAWFADQDGGYFVAEKD